MDVPIEILLHIFKFLPHRDRAAASQTCQLWYRAASDYQFKKKQCITLNKYSLQNEFYFDEIFKKDILHRVPMYKFEDIDVSIIPEQFWEINGPTVTELTFIDCELTERQFMKVIHKCPKLETVTVRNCRELFMSARLFEKSVGHICEHLNQLLHLNLPGNRYLTDALLFRFLISIDELRTLNLSECSITFHSGLHRKFYPKMKENSIDTGNILPSECILTFPFIKKFMDLKGKTIDKLYFNSTLIDGNSLRVLAETPYLKLTTLHLYQCDQLNGSGIKSICLNQKTLTDLNLGYSGRLNDELLKFICEHLTDLKALNISNCAKITNAGIVHLANLKKMQDLNISECKQITSDGIKSGICTIKNSALAALNISALSLEESLIELISETFPLLEELNMNFCMEAVTDIAIQAVFRNLKYLRRLYLKQCGNITDVGLTGMGEGKRTTATSSSSSPKDPTCVGGIGNSVSFTSDKFHRISLRSKAEDEIVKDAHRKRDVREMCENLIDINKKTGYSLVRLKNLVTLDLSICNKISDVSLSYAFAFNELRYLYLSECKQITQEGMEVLTRNCPSIEVLELINCFSLRDEAVETIAKNLKRLQELYLRGCNLLTNETIFALIKHCRSLKHLDVRTCRGISPEVTVQTYQIQTIQAVIYSKPGPYINEKVCIVPPPPPPVIFI